MHSAQCKVICKDLYAPNIQNGCVMISRKQNQINSVRILSINKRVATKINKIKLIK